VTPVGSLRAVTSARAAGRPLIAVAGRRTESAQGVRTPAVAAGRRYLDALERAGAIGAVLAPAAITADQAAQVLRRFDGLVLIGGGDIDPARYSQAAQPEIAGVDAERDEFELALAGGAVDTGTPLLAICRGVQVLNVALGGTLRQHITDTETTVQHRNAAHAVKIEPGSRLAALVGAELPACPSMHHQALDRAGSGLRIVARAADGIIEAVEHENRAWILGVQWHPEDSAATDASQQRIFDGFVTEASRSAR
jgi:putative glutamine amidotransferase